MEKHRAIPQGYMAVGEIAKKMAVTVRTMQYYDKEGILSPSAESEGGRRLYTNKDVVKLHQILAMKSLGFSLEDIKHRLPSVNTPQEISSLLAEQARDIRAKINSLKETLAAIEKLNGEVSLMDVVDWGKYADILAMLHVKNNAYWVMKYMDKDMVEHMRISYRQNDEVESRKLHKDLNRLMQRAAALQKSGHTPESKEGQELAKDWWEFIDLTTGGDVNMMFELMKLGLSIDESEWLEKNAFDKAFIGNALDIYFRKIGFNPFGKEEKND